MEGLKLKFHYIFICLIIFAILTEDVDARRKILRGRKTITRTYYRKAAIPAWSIILLLGFGELIIGGVVYIVMKKTIIDPPLTGSYSPAPTNIR